MAMSSSNYADGYGNSSVSTQEVNITLQPQSQGGTEPSNEGQEITGSQSGSKGEITLLHGGRNHVTGSPVNCNRCGEKVAKLLRDQLHAGNRGESTRNKFLSCNIFVASRSKELTDASGIVQGLRKAKASIKILNTEAEADEPGPAVNSVSSEEVVISWGGTIQNQDTMDISMTKQVVVVRSRSDSDSDGDADSEIVETVFDVVDTAVSHAIASSGGRGSTRSLEASCCDCCTGGGDGGGGDASSRRGSVSSVNSCDCDGDCVIL